ncbi:DsbA family protein [Psychrobacillus lasiicapitis]|uniref:Thiol-disulfide oxidoreductase n=1 Tax=Psychrobacillus lasiicapitis TaxID=1636719 RepID=A0A544TCA2_9BACI|nr:thioredoxin domain-containing protein [Psychrobacillus lasiicapitis]TQR15039.1 thiol-disulfide oxidoreductase [Psychrobacillus lasiicapitis]GGA21965.1 disulfide bond formation protein D [Psychrobacillus lasiicapitis]
MSKKLFWIIGIIAVCIIGIIVLTDAKQESVDIDYAGQPFIGEESAPVEIIEFGDYKCPHCGDFDSTLFPLIHEQFVETGKAKFYFMNYSFIAPDSTTSAQFAETVYKELGNEKFWEFHHLLFANQTTESGQENVMTEAFLQAVLAEVATAEEVEKVSLAYSESSGKEAWQKDMNIANNLGVASTPTIYIGGKEFTGATMDDFAKKVEEAADGK